MSVLAMQKDATKFRLFISRKWEEYNCECGKLLFRAKCKPVGLEIQCPKCRKLIQYGLEHKLDE
ncbi:hypothetical protein [Zhaonella formicivorans]|uniref:hypothetical protein n=1 Tax=Zhaonella formicivorans TaxID=2528593 RepID=UPI001D1068F5|nr:hypothetical protein [Zhaonella formicivorans]